MRAKFAGLTDAVLGAERAAALAGAVLAIDTTADVAVADAAGGPADGGAAGRRVASGRTEPERPRTGGSTHLRVSQAGAALM